MYFFNAIPHISGYIQSSTLKGNRTAFQHLKECLEKGKIEKLRTGLYKILEIANKDYYQEMTLLYPKAIICLNSAAAFYNLTDQIPAEMHLVIGQKTKMKILDYPPIQLHYWSEKMINQHQIITNEVKVFTIERTVCDIIRTYKNSDLELVKHVARKNIKLPTKDFDFVLRTADEIGVKEKVKSIFELMV
jgi:predicted transcriptional regulator of viral defense system